MPIVAFAEVDKGRWGGAAKHWAHAKGYTDWRKVFENHGKEIDTVFVATGSANHQKILIAKIQRIVAS